MLYQLYFVYVFGKTMQRYNIFIKVFVFLYVLQHNICSFSTFNWYSLMPRSFRRTPRRFSLTVCHLW
jgi:hypothetical protein